MATIVVRGLEGEVVRALKHRAVHHGRSMEEEVRQLLRAQFAGPAQESLAAVLMRVPGFGWEWPK